MSGNRTILSEYQINMLSDIFRLYVKEIKTEEDAQKLAPGEMGINYQNRTFYIKNPHTGELISPNSLEYLKPILDNYDQYKKLFNADTVNYIRFYNNISQLPQIGTIISADTIVRQMDSPSVLFSTIAYDDANYKKLGFPSPIGLLSVFKMHEKFASATFYDLKYNRTYDGFYNPDTHMLEGWICNSMHTTVITTTEGGMLAKAEYHKPIKDLEVLCLRVQHLIEPMALLSIDNQTAMPIQSEYGQRLPVALSRNTIIMLIYDAFKKVWVYCDVSVSPQTVLNRIMSERTTIMIDALKIKVVESDYVKTIESEDEVSFKIPRFDRTTDVLLVNYGQTVFRSGIDYDFVENTVDTIQMKQIHFAVGDQLYFKTTKYTTTKS